MSVTVTFACGHTQVITNPGGDAPSCDTCGDVRVQHVTAPAPRFRGFCTGPQTGTS